MSDFSIMANLIGQWKLLPELTTGEEGFLKALGKTDKQIEESRHVSCIFTLSQSGDTWHMKIDIVDGGTWIDLDFHMGIPFTYTSPDHSGTLTSLIDLKNDHFIEKMTSDTKGVIYTWDVDTYRQGDYLISVQTKDQFEMIQKFIRLP